MKEREIWKTVEGYENYQVSNLGNVKSLNYHNSGKEKLMKPIKDNRNGYLYVSLSKNGEIKHKLVHRLVAEAFIPNPDNLPCVSHLDETRAHNCVNNLTWATYSENNSMPLHKIRQRDGHIQNLDISKVARKVYCVELDKVFLSLRDAERTLGICHSNISRCCNGRYKTAGKFHWRYATAEDILRNGLQYADKGGVLYA